MLLEMKDTMRQTKSCLYERKMRKQNLPSLLKHNVPKLNAGTLISISLQRALRGMTLHEAYRRNERNEVTNKHYANYVLIW